MGCDVSLLTGINFFELLQDEDRLVLANVVDAITVNAGDILFHAGEPGESLFVVRFDNSMCRRTLENRWFLGGRRGIAVTRKAWHATPAL